MHLILFIKYWPKVVKAYGSCSNGSAFVFPPAEIAGVGIERVLLPSIDIVQRLMKVFAVSADNLLNDSENSVVELENHELNEQIMPINQLDEDEKNTLI